MKPLATLGIAKCFLLRRSAEKQSGLLGLQEAVPASVIEKKEEVA